MDEGLLFVLLLPLCALVAILLMVAGLMLFWRVTRGPDGCWQFAVETLIRVFR